MNDADTPKARAVEKMKAKGYNVVIWEHDMVCMAKGKLLVEVLNDGTVRTRNWVNGR